MAAADFFDIRIQGRGSHAAYPHKSADPVVIAMTIGQALQTIVSRNADANAAAVLSITQIHAGSAYNVIPDTAHLAGTIRTLDDDVRALTRTRLRELSQGIAASFGASADVEIRDVFSVLRNDPQKIEAVARAASDLFGKRCSTGPRRPTWAARISPTCCLRCRGPIAGSAWKGAARSIIRTTSSTTRSFRSAPPCSLGSSSSSRRRLRGTAVPMENDWSIPPEFQPKREAHGFDLDEALRSVVSLRAHVPEDAYTAETLGTEREGQGAVIRADGLVLTIGYLITEAEEIWLTTHDGRVVQAHGIAYDYTTGFGLVQAFGGLNVPSLAIGDSRRIVPGTEVVLAGAGGRTRSVAGQVVARQEFAGYWEYLIQDAIFTVPAHPHWGGTALLGPRGDLVGIGSLQLPHRTSTGHVLPLNMSLPIDLLKPILDDLLTKGRVDAPARPWLGVFSTEVDADEVVVAGLAGDGPAKRAGLREGDRIVAVAGQPASSLADLYPRHLEPRLRRG
jgi:S1-C subfamily serine protease